MQNLDDIRKAASVPEIRSPKLNRNWVANFAQRVRFFLARFDSDK